MDKEVEEAEKELQRRKQERDEKQQELMQQMVEQKKLVEDYNDALERRNREKGMAAEVKPTCQGDGKTLGQGQANPHEQLEAIKAMVDT